MMWHRTRSDHKRRAWDRVADCNTPLRCRLMLRKTLGNGGQPGSDALPAENRKNGVQVGRAALSSLDSVARRINMGHFVANRKTRASQGGAVLGNTPRRRGQRARKMSSEGRLPGSEASSAGHLETC